MCFERMSLEVWFDDYEYLIENDIGESVVKFLPVDAVREILRRHGRLIDIE